MGVKEILRVASTIVFILSIALNTVLVYIVATKTRNRIGIYKYMIISFALCNIVYSSTEFGTKPAIHIHGNSYMAYNTGFLADLQPWGFLSLCFFIAMYGVNTAVLALHFVYRYFLICRPTQMKLFELPHVLLCAIPVLGWGYIYGFITFYCFSANEEFYNYAQYSVLEKLGRDIRDLSFFCVFTYEAVDGKTTIYWKPTLGLLAIVVMMLFTFAIMVVCGVKIVLQLRKVAMCAKTISIQKQLLRALITQATIPFFMSYIPRFLMFFFVIMGYPPLEIYAFVPLVVTSYTMLDPVAIIVFIHEYRAAIVKMVKRLMLLSHRRDVSNTVTEPRTHTGDVHQTNGH
ncbi:7TM chemoreceptor [Ancylostoma caninum]|uniref:7TM chemoreceptor n=1 Tax=Ancylostoma caninum TaxID=29170 RepID=A0A368H2W5_ANCCA|nr:7TM chemoreceptor [Ancylostoma caninum]